MLDFGASSLHSNGISVVDRATLDTPTSYSMAFNINLNAGSVDNQIILSKHDDGDIDGWQLEFNGTAELPINRHDGNGGIIATTALVVGTTASVVITWTGTTATWNIDDAAAGSGSFSTAISTNTNVIRIGNDGNLANGVPAAIGQVMIWPNYVLTAAEISQYHAGITVPALKDLDFWHRGIAEPGIDEITSEIAVASGTVSLLADPSDAYFTETTLPDYLQTATIKLLNRSSDREFYTVTVPWRFLSIELMELANISSPQIGIPSSATLLQDLIDHGLVDVWRRNIGRLVKVKPNPFAHTVDLTFKSHEKFMSTYFSTDELTSITSTDNIGLARMDVGGTLSINRSTKALIKQEFNEVINLSLITTASSDGRAWLPVGSFEEKLNFEGLLSEDATTNKVIDSAFNEGLGDWTATTAGGGTVTAVSGTFHAFPQSVSDNEIEIVGAVGDNYITPDTVIAVVTSDVDMRLSFIHSNGFGIKVDWRLQRSTDSFYWKDAATPAWQSGLVWNKSEFAGHSADLLIHEANRSASDIIPIDTNEDWTLDIGSNSTGFNREIYQVDLTPSKFLYSPIVTSTSGAVTTVKDTTFRELTSGETNTIAGIDWTAGSTYMTLAGTPTDISDGTKGTLVSWINLDGGDATLMKIITSNGVKVELNRNASDKFQLLLEDSSGNQLVDVVSTASFVAGATWRCVMASWDLGAIPKVKFYVGDTDEANITTLLSGTVDYTETLWGFAANNDGTNELNGATTDFWFILDEFLDFDTQSNRRFFFGDAGEAVYTGDNGELPTGNRPDFYFTGDNTEYNLNKGTSSDFVVTGSPANEASLPTRGRGGAFTQLVYGGRGTCSFKFLTIQDPAWMATDENFVVVSWVYGTAEDDYDIIDYAKPSGGNPQFRYRRFKDVSGTPTLDATTSVDITVVPGTEYEVVAIWTSDSDGELGLAAKSLGIRFRDVSSETWTIGDTAAASVTHSTSERFTKIYLGSAPDADTTSLRAMNRINHLKFQPRVLSDEEKP